MYVLKAWIGLAAVSVALAGCCCDGAIEGNYPGDVTPLAANYSTMIVLASDVELLDVIGLGGDVGRRAEALDPFRSSV
jgi:hypothetical protein